MLATCIQSLYGVAIDLYQLRTKSNAIDDDTIEGKISGSLWVDICFYMSVHFDRFFRYANTPHVIVVSLVQIPFISVISVYIFLSIL